MKDAKEAPGTAPPKNGVEPPPPGSGPVAQALTAAIQKATTPVDPYLALGVETARRMQAESALSAALDGLRAAAAHITELEAKLGEHAPS